MAAAFGPIALERTHSRYNESIRRVNEEQLLLNLVRVRYNESPFKLSVSSIAAQYELTGSAEARPFFVAPNPANHPYRTFTSVLPDVAASAANRPTMTLIPATGDAIRRFLTPISADTLVFLGSTSWPISTVMRLWVERLNGVPNAASASGPEREFVPDFARFHRIAHLLQVAQNLEIIVVVARPFDLPAGSPLPVASVTSAAAVDAAKSGYEYRSDDGGASVLLVRKEHRLVMEVSPAAARHPVMLELEGLLNLQPGLTTYDLIVSSDIVDPLRFPTSPLADLHLSPRSTAQVYFFLSNGIEIPPEHIEAGLIHPPVAPDGTAFDERAVTEGLFTVHSCKGHKPPPNAYVAVKYRGYWYYVDDRDQKSKSTFALTLMLSRLDFGLQEPATGIRS